MVTALQPVNATVPEIEPLKRQRSLIYVHLCQKAFLQPAKAATMCTAPRARAVAAGVVSPVSTGQLFPSLMACLALPISAIAWWTPSSVVLV